MNHQLELNSYLSRSECVGLNEGDKRFLTECVITNIVDESPVGRRLALSLMKLNNRYNREVVSNEFINWLYYY